MNTLSKMALYLLISASLCVSVTLGNDPTSPSDDASFERLRASQETFRTVAEKVRPFLVRIETVGGAQPTAPRPIDPEKDGDGENTPPRPRFQNPSFRDDPGSKFVVADGPSTGLIYSSDGYIVTSSFNFVREPLLITVTLADGRRLAAELIARDQVRKVALLKIDARALAVPVWVEEADLSVGQWVIALGLGYGGDRPSVNVGIVSAFRRMLGNAFQTDAKLSPSNYGGPLCDLDGRVMGLSVPMAQRAGELAGIEFYDSGIGFAIPQRRLNDIVSVLKTGQSFYRGWLGIQIDPQQRNSVVVSKLANPSPMREAGVQPGDRIIGAEGKPVRHFGELKRALYMIPAGEEVTLEMESGERQFTVTITLAASSELGPLPDVEEPFDPSEPLNEPDDD